MNSREKYEYWLEAAKYDLETARIMLHGGRYMYVAFMSQQAIEKMVKGLHILFTGDEASRIHNIVKVFNNIFSKNEIKSKIKDDRFGDKAEEYKDFFDELLYYYIAERYPDYKRSLLAAITKGKAIKILKNLRRCSYG